MRRAFDLCQETNAILNEIKNTLHVEVREQIGSVVWIETGQLAPAIRPVYVLISRPMKHWCESPSCGRSAIPTQMRPRKA
jgi:hypothetical protein